MSRCIDFSVHNALSKLVGFTYKKAIIFNTQVVIIPTFSKFYCTKYSIDHKSSPVKINGAFLFNNRLNKYNFLCE